MFIDQKKHSLANNKRDKVSNEESDKENNPAITNLLVSKRKGRPETK